MGKKPSKGRGPVNPAPRPVPSPVKVQNDEDLEPPEEDPSPVPNQEEVKVVIVKPEEEEKPPAPVPRRLPPPKEKKIVNAEIVPDNPKEPPKKAHSFAEILAQRRSELQESSDRPVSKKAQAAIQAQQQEDPGRALQEALIRGVEARRDANAPSDDEQGDDDDEWDD